jgi:lysophospholipase L1-like esterase
LLLIVSCAVGVAVARSTTAQEEAPPTGEVVAFVGDSYTGGSDMDSGEPTRWPALVSSELGWESRIFAEGGAGYAQAGREGGTFANQLAPLVEEQPDVVVVAGGLNDLMQLTVDPHRVNDAASAVLLELRRKMPNVAIVVLSPFDHGAPRKPLVELGEHLRATAEAVDARYVDVLHVLADEARLVGSDGVHPNDAGHRAIAAHLLKQQPFGNT